MSLGLFFIIAYPTEASEAIFDLLASYVGEIEYASTVF